MLAMSKHPFAINPNPDLKEVALANGWTVYQPAGHESRWAVASDFIICCLFTQKVLMRVYHHPLPPLLLES